MPDTTKQGDQAITEDLKPKSETPDQAKTEATAGLKDQTKSVVDYYQARKNGMRDKSTFEYLGPQPQIVDDSKGNVKGSEGKKDAATTDLKPGETKPAEASKPVDQLDRSKPADQTDPSRAADHSQEPGLADKAKSLFQDVPSDAVLGSARVMGSQQNIDYDKDFHITKVTSADGKTSEMKYDSKGDLNEVKLPDGNTWKKDKEGWNQFDKNGKQIKHMDGTINVTDEGDVVGLEKGQIYWRQNHDGSSTVTNKDHSIVTKDTDGNPTEVIYPDGKRTEVHYNTKGEPLTIKKDGATYVQESGKWFKEDEHGNRVQEMNGKMTVDKNGDVSFIDKDKGTITKHTDGSTERKRSDGSEMVTDINDRVTKLKYPNGNTNEIEYDKNGDPTKIKGGAGDEWVKQGNRWSHKDEHGKEIDHLDGCINVTRSGDIVAVGKDGTFLKQDARGGFTETQKDKSIVSKDSDGYVTDVVYPNGKHTEVSYDDLHNPTSVKMDGEGRYDKNPDGTWTKYDENGKELKQINGDFKVGENGDVTLKDNDKGGEITRHTDGSTERHRADGSVTISDANDRPVKDVYPNGSSNEFKYDKDGNAIGMRDQDGNVWRKEGENNWNRYDKSGKRIAHFDGQVNVTKEGDIVAAGKDGREFHRKNHDGTNSISNDDQSITTKDDKGRVVEVTYPDAKQNGFAYDEKGQLNQIDANDGSHWNKENGKWVHYDRNDKQVGNFDGDIKTDADGNITVTNKDGNIVMSKLRDGRTQKSKDANVPDGI
jgi:YD repeat-containing protein